RNRALGVLLPDDMLVERGDDGLGSKCLGHFFLLSPPACGRGRGRACQLEREANRPSPNPSRKREGDYTVSTVTRSLVKTQTSAAIAMARRAISSASSS